MINTNITNTNNLSFRANYVAEVLKNDKFRKVAIATTSVAGVLLASHLKKAEAAEIEAGYSQTPLLVNSIQGDASIHELFGKVKSPLTFFKKDMSKIVNLPEAGYYNAIRKLTQNLPERRKKLEEQIQKNGYETTSTTREVENKNYDYVEKTVTYLDSKTGEIVKKELYRDDVLFDQDYFVYDSKGNLVEKLGKNSITKFDYKDGRLIQLTQAYDRDYFRITSYGKDGVIMTLEKTPYNKPVLKTNVHKLQNEENDNIDQIELEVRNILGYPSSDGAKNSIKTIFTNKNSKEKCEQIKKLISTYSETSAQRKNLFEVLKKYSSKEEYTFLRGISLIYDSSSSYMAKKIDKLLQEGKYDDAVLEVEYFANLDKFDRNILNDKYVEYGNHCRSVSQNGTVRVVTGHYEYCVTSYDHDLGSTRNWYVDSRFTYNLDNVAKEGWTREKILKAIQPMTGEEMFEFEKKLAKISAKYN